VVASTRVWAITLDRLLPPAAAEEQRFPWEPLSED